MYHVRTVKSLSGTLTLYHTIPFRSIYLISAKEYIALERFHEVTRNDCMMFTDSAVQIAEAAKNKFDFTRI